MKYYLVNQEMTKRTKNQAKIFIIVLEVIFLFILFFLAIPAYNKAPIWFFYAGLITILFLMFFTAGFYAYAIKYVLPKNKVEIEISDDGIKGRDEYGRWEFFPFETFANKKLEIYLFINTGYAMKRYQFKSLMEFLQNVEKIIQEQLEKNAKTKSFNIEFKSEYKNKKLKELFDFTFYSPFVESHQFERLIEEWHEKYEAYLKKVENTKKGWGGDGGKKGEK